MASTSMCTSQTSVSYCLVERPAPLQSSSYTYGRGRGRIWYRCRRLRLSPPRWECDAVLMSRPPTRRKMDSLASVESNAQRCFCVFVFRQPSWTPCATRCHFWSCSVYWERGCWRLDTPTCRPLR